MSENAVGFLVFPALLIGFAGIVVGMLLHDRIATLTEKVRWLEVQRSRFQDAVLAEGPDSPDGLIEWLETLPCSVEIKGRGCWQGVGGWVVGSTLNPSLLKALQIERAVYDARVKATAP